MCSLAQTWLSTYKPHATPRLVVDQGSCPTNALAPKSLELWLSFSSALNTSFMTGTFSSLVAKSIFSLETLRTFIVVWWPHSWHHFSGYWKYNEGNKKCYWVKTTQLIPGHTCRWTVQHNRIISEQRAEISFQSLGPWVERSRDEYICTGLWAFSAKPREGQSTSQQDLALLSAGLWASHLECFVLPQLASPLSSAQKADAGVPL